MHRRSKIMNFESTPQPIDILLVEDNEADVRLTQEVLTDSKVRNNLMIASNGEEALSCLRQQGKFRNSPRPDLILLDLNLPVKDGREVLAQIKQDPDLKSIPVVILTTSKAEEDIVKTYNLHANCYITKPVDLEQFVTVVNYIEDFWLAIVKLPKNRKTCSPHA
jgi:chemotaxis family two-component system response regulator Rcp1